MLLQDALAALLPRIPERWVRVRRRRADGHGVRSALLARGRRRGGAPYPDTGAAENHPVAIEAIITAMGEYGFAEAMEPVLAPI